MMDELWSDLGVISLECFLFGSKIQLCYDWNNTSLILGFALPLGWLVMLEVNLVDYVMTFGNKQQVFCFHSILYCSLS